MLRQRFGGLKPMQALDKYKARAVRPDEDRRLQTLVENAGRDLVYSLLFEGRTSLGRNVNVSDWDGLALHHDRTKGRPARTCDILYPLKALHCSILRSADPFPCVSVLVNYRATIV